MRAALAILALAGVAQADPPPVPDDELGRIPQATEDEPRRAARPASLDLRLYAEDAFTLTALRDPAVPFPPPAPTDAQNRTSLDAVLTWRPLAGLSFVLGDRADLVFEDGAPLTSSRTFRNELRELYVGWEPFARTYLEAGRINIRNGAALGYNPTDFFRPRTIVGQASLDPSVLGRNRLGTAMIRAQTIWTGGSASLVYAPRLYSPSAIPGDAIGIDPRLDATNAAHRALAEASFNLGDVSAQGLVYLEEGRSRLGMNLTFPIGQSVIAYAEWAGGPEKNLITRALEYGRATGTLPAEAGPPIPTDSSSDFANDVAVGGSWTIATRLTLNLEYHFHQSGLSRGDWDHWFDAGQASPQLAGELWYLRGYANAELEPAAMHQIFLRLAWPKAIGDHIEIDGIAFVSLLDGSVLSQTTASYYLSDAWTAALTLGGNFGSARSERGSLPQSLSGIFELVRYL